MASKIPGRHRLYPGQDDSPPKIQEVHCACGSRAGQAAAIQHRLYLHEARKVEAKNTRSRKPGMMEDMGELAGAIPMGPPLVFGFHRRCPVVGRVEKAEGYDNGGASHDEGQ